MGVIQRVDVKKRNLFKGWNIGRLPLCVKVKVFIVLCRKVISAIRQGRVTGEVTDEE